MRTCIVYIVVCIYKEYDYYDFNEFLEVINSCSDDTIVGYKVEHRKE